MTWLCRCDSCKTIFLKNELTKIIDEKGRSWYRCKDCVRKYRKKPFDLGYYAYLQFEGVTGLEYEEYVVPYSPKKFSCDKLDMVKKHNKKYF